MGWLVDCADHQSWMCLPPTPTCFTAGYCRDETGPRLWHFPLTTKATNPQDGTVATAPQLPIPAPTGFLHHHPVSRNCPRQPQRSFCQPLLLQYILIPARASFFTSTSGVACLVYYLYGAAQAVALAAHATGTTFNHAALISPALVPWLECMGIFSGALQLQQDATRTSWLLHPHTCQTSNLMVLGLLCQEWLLHWSSPGVIPLRQTGQLGHQKPSYLRYPILPFLPCCPCTVHR
jgi:hypothetical protein